jgi:8-amino-7-oxononanoate synthase
LVKTISAFESLKRRDYPRFDVKNLEIPVVIYKKNLKVIKGKVLDVSSKGLSFVSGSELRKGDKYFFSILFPEKYDRYECFGRIVWSCRKDSSFCAGAYIENNCDNSEVLNNFIFSNGLNLREVNRRSPWKRQFNSTITGKMDHPRERRLSKQVFLKCIRYDRYESAVRENAYYYMREIQSSSAVKITRNGKKMLNLASNNYLSLADHPEVKRAARRTIKKYGVGPASSRLLSGTTDLHRLLEETLADFTGGEACMVCNTGYNLNIGIIAALASPSTNLIIDKLVHASIIDGCFAAKSKIHLFKHNDMQDLHSKIHNALKYGPGMIITDGVFSMDGDLAPLQDLYNYARKYNMALMIDDAHGIGVLGSSGKGLPQKAGLLGKIDLYMATMGKAIGCMGGFVVAPHKIIQYLKHTCRSFIFSISLPAFMCAAALKSIEIIKREPERRTGLFNTIRYLKRGLILSGFDVGKSDSAIVPLYIRDETLTLKLAGFLEKEGVLVNPIACPAVKSGTERIRLSVQSDHTEKDMDFFLDKLLKAKKCFNL